MKTILPIALSFASFLPVSPLLADEAASAPQLSADEVAQLRALLKASAGGAELTPRQADSVRGLIKETKADPDYATAGFDDRGRPFIASGDGRYRINLNGLFQGRYVWNNQSGRGDPQNLGTGNAASDDVYGFSIAHAELGVDGALGDQFTYLFRLQKDTGTATTTTATTSGTPPVVTKVTTTSTATNVVSLQDAYVGWKVTPEFLLQAGYFRAPFGREAPLGHGNQLGVSIGVAADRFDLGRAEGLLAQWQREGLKLRGALQNGTNLNVPIGFNGNTPSTPEAVAGTTRAEYLFGDWKDFADNYALAGDDRNEFLLGASFNYNQYSGNSGSTWTSTGSAAPAAVRVQTAATYAADLDATWKIGRFALAGSLYGLHADNAASVDLAKGSLGFDQDTFGAGVSVDYRIVRPVDVFVRYDWLDDQHGAGPATRPIHAVATGANWQLHRNVRLSGDVLWVIQGDAESATLPLKTGNEFSASTLGLVAPPAGHGAGGQVALRAQLQVFF